MEEQWVAFPGFEGYYEFSNYGRVRSLPRLHQKHKTMMPGKLLSLGTTKDGYVLKVLKKQGEKAKGFLVHREVARVFLPPSTLPQVNHRDCNKANNRWDNLEWSTNDHNLDHARANNLFSASVSPRRAKRLTLEMVADIRQRHQDGQTVRQIADYYTLHVQTVRDILSRKIWK